MLPTNTQKIVDVRCLYRYAEWNSPLEIIDFSERRLQLPPSYYFIAVEKQRKLLKKDIIQLRLHGRLPSINQGSRRNEKALSDKRVPG
jgi:hypothetical protein